MSFSVHRWQKLQFALKRSTEHIRTSFHSLYTGDSCIEQRKIPTKSVFFYYFDDFCGTPCIRIEKTMHHVYYNSVQVCNRYTNKNVEENKNTINCIKTAHITHGMQMRKQESKRKSEVNITGCAVQCSYTADKFSLQ